MGRLQNSIELAKSSWNVLRDDKKLTALPVLSALSALVVALVFFGPIALIANNGAQSSSKPLVWILGIVGYVTVTFVLVFFNAALVFAADKRLRGEPVTISEAVHAAGARVHVLLPWAVVTATVSLVIRAIEERSGIAGRIIGSLVGLAWSLVTFLVLPVIVVEQVGPIEAVKRSAALFKHTWGENMIANAGIGIVAMFASLIGILPCLLLIAVGGPVAFVGIGIAVAWVIAVQLVATTLTGILQIALYRFANDGTVPGFDNDKLREMFRPRGSGGGMGGLRRFGPGGAAGGGFSGGGFTGGGFDGPTSPN